MKKKAITYLGLTLLNIGKPFTKVGNWFWKKHKQVLDWND
tara:strand:+ start:240 stop:359 length:120 start_codon:yes stop_codon:yes gene_type:complete